MHGSGDLHLYPNHLEQADEQLSREPFALPPAYLRGERSSRFDFRYGDIELADNRYHPTVRAAVST